MRARDNPFRVDRLHSLRYRFAEGGWPQVMERLAAAGGRGAVVGAKGHGKTTFLLELGDRLKAFGVAVDRVRIRPEDGAAGIREVGRSLARRVPGSTLLVDGAGALPADFWSASLEGSPGGGGVVVTSHVESALPTVHRCETSKDLLAELVAELDPASRLAADLDEIWRFCGGDLRVALRRMYDRCGVTGG